MKTLVIAEKPSVAQDIVRSLTPVSGKFEKHEDHFENDRYVVTSAVGHLVEIAAPEEFDVKRGKWSFAHLPVLPPYFELRPIDKTKSRLAAVVKQAKRKDVTDIINACDAGREGELIFRLIEQYAGGAKGGLGKPVQRLWLQSMTPQASRDGFNRRSHASTSTRPSRMLAATPSATTGADSPAGRPTPIEPRSTRGWAPAKSPTLNFAAAAIEACVVSGRIRPTTFRLNSRSSARVILSRC